jgi:alpha-glucosidase
MAGCLGHPLPAADWTVDSPNREVRATVELDANSGTVSYQVRSRGVTVIEKSPLGITTSQGDFTGGMSGAGSTARELQETYVLPVGKRSTYVNHANELALAFRKNERALQIRFRTYNDGIAFATPWRAAAG